MATMHYRVRIYASTDAPVLQTYTLHAPTCGLARQQARERARVDFGLWECEVAVDGPLAEVSGNA